MHSKSVTESGREIHVLQLHRGPVHPPSNGEERRVWETAKKFSEFATVWLAHPEGDGSSLAPGVESVDTRNPFLEYKTTCIYGWNAALGLSDDPALDALQARMTVRRFADFAPEPDAVCVECPQMLRAGVRLADRFDAALVLNKHNAMYELLDQQLRIRPVPGFLRRRAVENLRRFEQRGIDAADAVVFQSADDREQFRCPDDAVVEVIPNGTEVEPSLDGAESDRLRERLGIGESATVCLFVGAYDYDPNAAAAEVISSELAPALPEIEFLLVGRNPPDVEAENVHAPGFVRNLDSALALADVAICPLTLGSGTKLKMMDYLAAGLPIVTTEVGAQGIPLRDGETALIRDPGPQFAAAIRDLAESPELRSQLSSAARRLGRQYRWESLLEGYESVMREVLDVEETRDAPKGELAE